MDHAGLETVEVGPLTLSAAVGTIDEENRTVEVIFSTGAAVERYDYWTGKRYIEKLALKPENVRLERLNSGAPILNAHAAYSLENVVGVVEEGSASVSGGKGKARVRFSQRADVEPFWQDVRGRIIRNVSVGYRVHRFEEVPGKKEGDAPIRTATDWEPFEISLVPMGADPGARVRGAHPTVETNPCVIVRSLEERAMVPENKTPQPAEPAATPAPVPEKRLAIELASDPAIEAKARDAERERAEGIRKLVRGSKLANAESIADDMIKRGITIDAARAETLTKLTAASDEHEPAPGRIRVGEDASDKRRAGIVASLLVRAGVVDLIRAAAKKRPDLPAFAVVPTDPGEFRSLSLLELSRAALEERGERTRGWDKNEVAGQMLRTLGEIAMRGTASVVGAQSTSDFPIALETTLNKVLLAAYVIAPDTWRRFCAVGSLNDFRPHPRYRTGYLGALDLVPQGGEFKNKNIPDAVRESVTAATKGNILALTRQTLINDDMGIFNRVATQAGRAAALSIESDVYALLALNGGLGPLMSDGLPLFDAAHANIGTGSALSVAGLDDDAVVLGLQTDPQGNEILDLRPAILLVSRGQEGTARVINGADYDVDQSAAAGARNQLTPNRVQGMFRDIVGSGRLSGVRRYIFTDPAGMPVLEVDFLDGVQEPFLDMQDGWRIDGVEWKVRLDYGVGAVEVRGAVTNEGVPAT